MPWLQNYNPLGSLLLSALVAGLPVFVLLGLLAFFHVRAHIAALISLALSLAIAIFVYGMPAQLAALSSFYGAAFGLFPIGWIVLCAIFIYDINVKTGKFEIVKHSIAAIASDRRIQALLVCFSFGAFIEGAAGFGTPVAISAAMLIGLGFKPLHAAGLSLIGNTAPVAYGALGTPLITLANITNLPLYELSAMVGRQLPFFSIIVPFWLVWAMAGWRGMLEVWPACIVTGGSFAVTQYLVSNFHGPWVVDILSSIVSLACSFLLLKVWQPKTVWRFESELEPASSPPRLTSRSVFLAWMPWLLLSVFVFVWGLQPVKEYFNGGVDKSAKNGIDERNFLNGKSSIAITVPYLDKNVIRDKPVVKEQEAEKAVFTFNWLSATGTALLLSGILSGLLLGLSLGELARVFWGTFRRVQISLVTIAAMLALGYTTRFAGLDATMGLAFASTGSLFPFFSPLLGWLGVALTGSDTASNVLFGNLQQVTADKLGFSPLLAAASNSSGGVMGKMIDAQSIVVAGVATQQEGQEGTILRYVFFHSLALAALVGVLVFFQAHYATWMIPELTIAAADRDPAWAAPVKCACLRNCYKISDTLYRCAQPDPEGMKEARELGIKTVINLRAIHSDKDEIGKLDLLNEELSIKPWHIEDEDVVRVMKMLGDPAGAPYLIHCQHGSDRTGLMIAMYRIIHQGWTKEKALDEMKRGGYGFHAIWQNIVRYVDNVDVEKLRAQINAK